MSLPRLCVYAVSPRLVAKQVLYLPAAVLPCTINTAMRMPVACLMMQGWDRKPLKMTHGIRPFT